MEKFTLDNDEICPLCGSIEMPVNDKYTEFIYKFFRGICYTLIFSLTVGFFMDIFAGSVISVIVEDLAAQKITCQFND